MTYYIQYTTATHKAVDHREFDSLDEAREEMLREHTYWLNMLACIVEADDSEAAMDADAIECASDHPVAA